MMPNSYYTCGQVVIGNDKPTVKFSKYARHDKETLAIDAIVSSIENKIESALGLKVIGLTSTGIQQTKSTWVVHLGKKEDDLWVRHGHVTVSC